MLAIVCCAVGPLRADEPFETAEPTWKLAAADCQARLAGHQRTFSQAHSGHGSEYVAVQAPAGGSYVYLSHAIEPARVIPELAASVWVLSDRTGIQLLLRVVLPRTIDPRSQAPLTTLVHGEMLEEAGGWRRLAVDNLPERLDSQARVLRRQLPQTSIDVREAYVDLVVINAYGGSGLTQLWIDDLELAGSVASPEFREEQQPPAVARASRQTPALEAVLRGTVLEIEGRPAAPRIIEHQGESLEWLKSLGFTAVKLARPPSSEQLAEARRLKLWLIAPPPQAIGGRTITDDYDRVLAWDLGSDLAGPDLEATKALAGAVRQADPARRPLICAPRAKFWNYSRLADILMVELPSLGGSIELDELGDWLRARQGMARPGTPVWVSLASAPSQELQAQLEAIAGGLRETPGQAGAAAGGAGDSGPDNRGAGDISAMDGAMDGGAIDVRQLRLVALRAAAAGARGVCFRSSSRMLDGDARSQALSLVNLDLSLIEPWSAAGEFAAEIPASDPSARVTVMSTDRSQLLVATPVARGQQYELPPPAKGDVSFVVAGAPRSSRAYLVTPTGLVWLRDARRVAGGLRVAVPAPGPVRMVVLTENPLVLNHLSRRLAESNQSAAAALRQIALARLTAVETIDRQLTAQGRVQTEALTWLTEARASLRTCEQLLDAADYGASQQHAELALSSLARIRHSRWLQAASAFATPVASPCCTSFDALPLHWRLASRLKSQAWGENVLPAGGFEDLSALEAAGWRHYRGADAGLATTVELAASAARQGASGLVLRATADDGQPAVETPPLWITSAPVRVKAGQLVRISGWVKLPRPVTGASDGLLIFDSAGGLPLALRIREPGEWREFVFYRAAPADGELSVTLALSGAGEAWVDELAISLLAGPGG